MNIVIYKKDGVYGANYRADIISEYYSKYRIIDENNNVDEIYNILTNNDDVIVVTDYYSAMLLTSEDEFFKSSSFVDIVFYQVDKDINVAEDIIEDFELRLNIHSGLKSYYKNKQIKDGLERYRLKQERKAKLAARNYNV